MRIAYGRCRWALASVSGHTLWAWGVLTRPLARQFVRRRLLIGRPRQQKDWSSNQQNDILLHHLLGLLCLLTQARVTLHLASCARVIWGNEVKLRAPSDPGTFGPLCRDADDMNNGRYVSLSQYRKCKIHCGKEKNKHVLQDPPALSVQHAV